MIRRRMASLALGLVCAGMMLSVSGHAGWAPQKAQAVSSMSSLDLPALKKPISKRFVNAKLSEVLAWLSLEQFSFVADSSEFAQESSVTLNFRNQPLGAVLDAIADAFNGRWERRGEIFNLRPQIARNSIGNATFAPLAGSGIARTTAEPVPFAVAPPRVAEKAASTLSPLGAPTQTWSPAARALTSPIAPGSATLPSRVAAPLGTVTAPSLISPLGRASEAIEKVRSVSPALVPLTTRPAEIRPGIAVPLALSGRMFTTPAPAAVSQDPKAREEMKKAHEHAMKAHEQAMKEAERALKMAEQEMKKLHENGEWKRAMEKAMAEARNSPHSDEHKKAMEQAHKAMDEARRAMQNMPNSAEWKKAWQKAREEMAKALKEGKVMEDGKERKMTDKERQAIEKSMRAFEKIPDVSFAMPKLDSKAFSMPKLDSKVFTMPNIRSRYFMAPDDPEFKTRNEQIKKEIELMNKHMKDLKIDGKVFAMPHLDGKTFVMPKVDAKAFTMPKVKMDELMKLEGFEKARTFGLDSRRMRIVELLESLTGAQKEKQEKQGHLNLEDLTPKQREMLGDVPKEGNWTFSYSIDGKKLTIKNKA